MWTTKGNLKCDTCDVTLDGLGEGQAFVLNRARARGWHVYFGPVIAKVKRRDAHICPDCMGTNRSRLPAPPPRLEDDQPLFELPVPGMTEFFEEDEPVADVVAAFERAHKVITAPPEGRDGRAGPASEG